MSKAADTMTVRPVRSDEDLAEARRIRTRVFVEEQGCPPDVEWDGRDDTSRLVLGWENGEAIATARWRAVSHDDEIVAKLERFAVLPDYRGEGRGTELVEAVLDDARRAGFDTFLIHAQTQVEGWYAEFGFESTGKTFEEAGLPHIEMVKSGN